MDEPRTRDTLVVRWVSDEHRWVIVGPRQRGNYTRRPRRIVRQPRQVLPYTEKLGAERLAMAAVALHHDRPYTGLAHRLDRYSHTEGDCAVN